MTKTLPLLLFLLPACAMAPTLGDGANSSDSGPRPDAVVVLPDGAIVRIDSAIDDATSGDAFAQDIGIGPDAARADTGSTTDDAASAATDAGSDAATFSGDAWPGACGDGYIDLPETCDPGSSHNSQVCPGSGRGACEWCVFGLIGSGPGCVYGDYLYMSPPMTWSLACRPVAGEQLSWIVWHTAADRDAIIAAYRGVMASGGTTNASGWVGLHAASDTSPFLWVDDGSSLTASTLLPVHNARSAGHNCMTLTVTDIDAYFTYSLCTGSTGLCITQPWGIVR